jgi:hypothetical protein
MTCRPEGRHSETDDAYAHMHGPAFVSCVERELPSAATSGSWGEVCCSCALPGPWQTSDAQYTPSTGPKDSLPDADAGRALLGVLWDLSFAVKCYTKV